VKKLREMFKRAPKFKSGDPLPSVMRNRGFAKFTLEDIVYSNTSGKWLAVVRVKAQGIGQSYTNKGTARMAVGEDYTVNYDVVHTVPAGTGVA
jgi:hypothetical protein